MSRITVQINLRHLTIHADLMLLLMGPSSTLPHSDLHEVGGLPRQHSLLPAIGRLSCTLYCYRLQGARVCTQVGLKEVRPLRPLLLPVTFAAYVRQSRTPAIGRLSCTLYCYRLQGARQTNKGKKCGHSAHSCSRRGPLLFAENALLGGGRPSYRSLGGDSTFPSGNAVLEPSSYCDCAITLPSATGPNNPHFT
ncbi:hypothetical protein J6590_035205 [Homalodisca vitripennis]|nr:hypothetical protein J6590_035205 [Homalodisca vitripennis]